VGFDGMSLIADIRLIYDNYDFPTQILVASVRHPMHVVEAAKSLYAAAVPKLPVGAQVALKTAQDF